MSDSLNFFKFNKYQIIFIFLLFLNLIIISNQNYTIEKLSNYSVTPKYWNISEKYIYYIDIQDYKIGDENSFQVLSENENLIRNLYCFEINESILNNITGKSIEEIKDIEIIRNISKNFSVKRRLSPKAYYFEVIFSKISENQKNFVVLFQPDLLNDNTKIDFCVSNPIPIYNIYLSDIDEGNIFSKTFYMDSRIENFFRFNFINISLEEKNLLFYVNDKFVSSFYRDSISSKGNKVNIFVIEKNTTNDLNHTIYLSLLGEAKNTKLQIVLDYHDIKYFYSNRRNNTSLFVEILNCKKDFYIIENYFQYEKVDFNYYLDTIPFYGDYEILYYENIIGNTIDDIFKPNNEIIIRVKPKKVSSFFNIIKISCNTSTLIKIKYLSEYAIKTISDGQEITSFMPIDEYTNRYIKTDDKNKKYKFYFGIMEGKESRNYSDISITFNKEYPINLKISNKKNKTYLQKEIYFEKEPNLNLFEFQTYYDGEFIKTYLISNLYYKNVVDGLTKIINETKAIAFKLKREIVYDYFIFKAYSHNKNYKISCDYELKIVSPSDIEKGKVLLGINAVQQYHANEIFLQFSNPYNKYYSRINKEDNVYLLASFIVSEKYKDYIYPLYTDIRYFCNNKIINLKNSEPIILKTQKEYKLSGDKDFLENNKIIININKCYENKTYFIKSYYGNDNNKIGEAKITEKRTLLSYDNLFDSVKFIISSNDSSNPINKDEDSNNILQASYYEKGDILMNYFSLNESLLNEIKITEDYSISHKDNRKEITLNWNNYILNNNDIIPDLKVNYSLYILPKNTPIKTICQMSLIPPNISLINKVKYKINLSQGKYKVGIMSSIVNEVFPMMTFYDILELSVPRRINIILIIIIVSSTFVLIFLITLYVYCKKKSKINDEIRISSVRNSNMISMAKFFGYDEEENEEILNNDENDNNNLINNTLKEKIINNNEKYNDNFSEDDIEDD